MPDKFIVFTETYYEECILDLTPYDSLAEAQAAWEKDPQGDAVRVIRIRDNVPEIVAIRYPRDQYGDREWHIKGETNVHT